MLLKDFPVIKLVLLFSVGIIIQYYFEFPIFYSIIILLTFAILSLILFNIKKDLALFFTKIFILFSIILTGIISYGFSQSKKTELPFENDRERNITVTGVVEKLELPRRNEIRFELKADSLGNVKNGLKLLIRIFNDSQMGRNEVINKLKIGNTVSITGNYNKGKERRNPYEFDYHQYLIGKGISGVINVESKNLIINNNEINIIPQLIYNLRLSIYNFLEEKHEQNTSSLLKGLLLAHRSEIDYDIRTEFINTGVVHVLAVSGLHVGFIILIFHFLFGRFHLILKCILIVAGLLMFLIITGSPTSVIRASVMASVFIAAIIFQRNTNQFNTLSIAGLIILIYDPTQLFSAGFQLSFAAVFSIISLYPIYKNKFEQQVPDNSIIKFIINLFVISFIAQIGTLPFTIYYFGKISLVALLANLFVIPLIGCIVGIGIATLFFGLISNYLAYVYAAANDLLTLILFNIISFISRFEFSYLRVPDFTFYDALVLSLIIIFFFVFIKKIETAFRKIIFSILLIVNTFLFLSFDDFDLIKKEYLDVVMIDVGQGDSFLLHFNDGTTAIIDAGEKTHYFDAGERIIIPLLENLGIKKIDYGFVTHLDNDHYGGFITLIEKGFIKKIILPHPDSSKKTISFMNLIKNKNVNYSFYNDTIYNFGNSRIYSLVNTKSEQVERFKSNDRSGVLKLVHGKNSFLFIGDIERSGENYITDKYKNFLDVEILKVGHHGSKTSSSDKFLKYVTPEISLISAGVQNRFKHPSPEILERLKNYSGKILRTDLEGAVFLRSDGKNLKHIDWKKRKEFLLLN